MVNAYSGSDTFGDASYDGGVVVSLLVHCG